MNISTTPLQSSDYQCFLSVDALRNIVMVFLPYTVLFFSVWVGC